SRHASLELVPYRARRHARRKPEIDARQASQTIEDALRTRDIDQPCPLAEHLLRQDAYDLECDDIQPDLHLQRLSFSELELACRLRTQQHGVRAEQRASPVVCLRGIPHERGLQLTISKSVDTEDLDRAALISQPRLDLDHGARNRDTVQTRNCWEDRLVERPLSCAQRQV